MSKLSTENSTSVIIVENNPLSLKLLGLFSLTFYIYFFEKLLTYGFVGKIIKRLKRQHTKTNHIMGQKKTSVTSLERLSNSLCK